MDTLVRVDMDRLEAKLEPVPDGWQRLGGRALVARFCLDEIPPTCDPLGRSNKLIFCPGLLGGTNASSSHRISVGGKSPLTGTVKESNGGGTPGQKLARLGLKAIIVQGKPRQPGLWVLHVSQQGARLDPADDLALLPATPAAERLRTRYGAKVAISLIGPAGERKLFASGVLHTDKEGVPWRISARGGMGAVMASKGLKAIVYDDAGTSGVPLADKQLFAAAAQRYHKLLFASPLSGKAYPEYGTAGILGAMNDLGALPTRNFSTGRFELADRINGETLRELILERGGVGNPSHACMPGCTIRSSNVVPDHKGECLVSPLEYETLGMVGANCGIGDLDQIAAINRACNEMGVDTIDVGGALAIAMEAGVIAWGDGERCRQVVERIASGDLLGRLIGSGGVMTAKVLGVERIPAVKGQIMSAYDPRAVKGLGVTYATSPQGADHTCGTTARRQMNHHSAEGQVEASRAVQVNVTIYDNTGLCMFAAPGVGEERQVICDLLKGRYGWELTPEDLLAQARQTILDEREFNRRAGFSEAHDKLPDWFREEENPASGTVWDIPDAELQLAHRF